MISIRKNVLVFLCLTTHLSACPSRPPSPSSSQDTSEDSLALSKKESSLKKKHPLPRPLTNESSNQPSSPQRDSIADAPKTPMELAEKALSSGNLQQAAKILEPLTQQNPPLYKAMLLLARARISQRRHLKAVKILSSLLENDSLKASAHAGIARAFFLENKIKKSLKHAQKAVFENSSNASHKRLLGEILLRLHRPGEAEKVLRKTLSLLPKSSWSWCLLGDALWAQQKYNEALASYKKGSSFPDDGKVWQAAALDKMGTLLKARKKNTKAQKVLQRCKSRYPKLGCPYTEAALSPPDPTRPHRRELFVKKRRLKQQKYEK